MNRKRAYLLLAAAALLLSASLGTLAGLGDDGSASDLDVIHDPPGGSECICPHVWDPVVCRAPDGSRAKFSNACVAACHGFANCVKIAILP